MNRGLFTNMCAYFLDLVGVDGWLWVFGYILYVLSFECLY